MSLRKFLEPSEKPKVICTDNSQEFGKSCEDLSWNHRASTLHRSETIGIADEPYAEKRKRRLLYCCNEAWMKSGGLILWNAIAICEMSKTSWRMGKHVTNGDLENHLKARSFRLVQWLKIIQFLQKDLARLLQFGKKVLHGILLWICIICGRNLERRYFGRRHRGAGNFGRVSEIHARRLHAKEIITPKRVYNSYSQSQMEIVKLSGGDQVFRRSI